MPSAQLLTVSQLIHFGVLPPKVRSKYKMGKSEQNGKKAGPLWAPNWMQIRQKVMSKNRNLQADDLDSCFPL